jgi:hypothetical protein
MPMLASHLRLDLTRLPHRSAELGVAFSLGTGNNSKPILLVSPDASAAGAQPYARYAVGLSLEDEDGPVAGNLGQLVVTGDRLIGMLIKGTARQARLDAATGAVYAFTIGRADLEPPEPAKNWRGQPTAITLRSRNGQRPACTLTIRSVIGILRDHGSLSYKSSLTDLLAALS